MPKNMAWSVKVYTDGREARNHLSKEYSSSTQLVGVVPPLSPTMDCYVLDFWLQHFVMEVKRRDGLPYPAITLQHLCVGKTL